MDIMGDYEPFSKEDAAQWLRDYEYEAKLVQHCEQADNPQSINKYEVKGSRAFLTIGGYVTLIKAYIASREGEYKELEKFCLSLEDNFFSKEDAAQWLRDYEYDAKLVQHYEQADNPQSINKYKVEGSIEHLTIGGYVTLIKAYIASREGEYKELEKFCQSLEDNLKYLSHFRPGDKKFTEKLIKDLKCQGKAYISYGSHNRTHLNFIKFSKKDDKYYATVYNAGDYINKVQEDIATTLIALGDNAIKDKINAVTPAITYQMNEGYGIEEIIAEFLQESGKLSNEEFTEKNKNRLSSPIRGIDKIVNEQKVGNCTTRSIREALRDNIPKSEFRKLYNFINNTPYSEMLKNVGSTPSIFWSSIKIPISEKEMLTIVEKKIKDRLSISKNAKILELNSINIVLDKDRMKAFTSTSEGVDFITNLIERSITRDCIEKYKIPSDISAVKVVEDQESYFFINDRNKIIFKYDEFEYEGSLIKINAKKQKIILNNGEILSDPQLRFIDSGYVGGHLEIINEIKNKIIELDKKEEKFKITVPSLYITHYTDGFNVVTKKLLLEDIANNFAEDNKLDKELTKDLWKKMFAASLEDIDLPLTYELLKPVKDHFSKVIKRHGNNVTHNNFDEVLTDWRVACLTDNLRNKTFVTKFTDWASDKLWGNKKLRLEDILKDFQTACINDSWNNLIIKAPILKGLIDDNKENFEELSKTKLPEQDRVIDYHNILKKEQTINIEQAQLKKPLLHPGYHHRKYQDVFESQEVKELVTINTENITGKNFAQNRELLIQKLPKGVERVDNFRDIQKPTTPPPKNSVRSR